MVIQAHHVTVGEELHEEFMLALRRGATVLHIHRYGLPHGRVELVEMHDEHAEPVPRRFIVIDSFCCHPIPLPEGNLHFIAALPFDNHVWNFFEILDSGV